jgi:hypothetical protein
MPVEPDRSRISANCAVAGGDRGRSGNRFGAVGQYLAMLAPVAMQRRRRHITGIFRSRLMQVTRRAAAIALPKPSSVDLVLHDIAWAWQHSCKFGVNRVRRFGRPRRDAS